MPTVRYTTVNGEVIAEKRTGVRQQYVPDPMGSTIALLNNTQAQTDTFSYWPYGENRTRTGTTPTPFQFEGAIGYYRNNTSKTYVRARVLDTQKGRWLTEDPIGSASGDHNVYRFVGNSPTNRWVDFTGTANDTPPWLTPKNPRYGAPTMRCLREAVDKWKTIPSSKCKSLPDDKLYNIMLCIIGCENADEPGRTDPFQPDDKCKKAHPHDWQKYCGIGPCRIVVPNWPQMEKLPRFKDPGTDPCTNTRLGVALFCQNYNGKDLNKLHWLFHTLGEDCFSKCMASKGF